MRLLLLMTMPLVLVACATASTIVKEGPDSYLAYKQGATGFTGTAPLKIEALQDASQYCVGLKKEFVVVSTNEIPGGTLGKYPGAEVRFMCLDASDPEFKRPKLQPAATNVIELRQR